jgi:hypothetical protein
MWLKPIILLTFAFFLRSATSSPTPELSSLTTDYDVIVVGGGPSGLGALSSLGRIRRKALMIDSAQYRNAPTRLMHDVAGFDGFWSLLTVLLSYLLTECRCNAGVLSVVCHAADCPLLDCQCNEWNCDQHSARSELHIL